LHYSSLVEALGEQFHASPNLLRRLNPGAQFAAGEKIQVPNVESVPTTPAPSGAAKIVVSKGNGSLIALDAANQVILFAPVTSGSEHDPLPIGDWKVTAVVRNPSFNYNPDLFWDADPSHAKAKIPPGPNGPVGLVWIDLSKEHYGIHGSPEPRMIGKSTSHGCVRLTNWDALALARLVQKGTPVVFEP
jgi:lipoprotein-anchoring transpeptidase ErfK/SrfK